MQCLRTNTALNCSRFLLFKFLYSLFLIFQVKESYDFYANELSAFQFKVMVWAISLHYSQLQYVHSVHANAYQQNIEKTKASNLYNGLEWDGSCHLMDQQTKWFKTLIEHRNIQYVNITCHRHVLKRSKILFIMQRVSYQHELLGKLIHIAYLLYQ